MATSASCSTISPSCSNGALRAAVIGLSGNIMATATTTTVRSCTHNSEEKLTSLFRERQTSGAGGKGDGEGQLAEMVQVTDGGCLSTQAKNINGVKNDAILMVNRKADCQNRTFATHVADVSSKALQPQMDNTENKEDDHQLDTGFLSEMYNENTVKKTKSCLRKLTGFFKSKEENRPLEQIPSDELDSLLCLFFKEARKLDGDEFGPMSLGAFQCALDRYLRQHKYPCDILSDHTFALSRGFLIARKKELRIKQLKKGSHRTTLDVNRDNQREIIDCTVQHCDDLSSYKVDQIELESSNNVKNSNSISHFQNPQRTVADPEPLETGITTVPSQVSQNLEKVYDSTSQSHMRNVLTVRKTISCVRRMTSFFCEKGEERPVEQVPPNELDKLLCSFFREVKKLDGGEFEPMSLSAFQCALDRYLRDKNYPYNTLTDVDFALSRSVLNAKKKELKELSKGKKSNSSFELTQEEEDALWKDGVLGSVTNASSLQRTVWYFNRKFLGLKCSQESYELRWGDLQLKFDLVTGEYLVYNDRIQKAKCAPTSSLSSVPKLDGNMCTIWPDNKSSERCPIQFYKEFLKRRPHSACLPDSPFYLSVKQKRMPDDKIFYKNCSLGIHSLEKMLKTINLPSTPFCDGEALNVDSKSRNASHQLRLSYKKSVSTTDIPITKAVSVPDHFCLIVRFHLSFSLR